MNNKSYMLRFILANSEKEETKVINEAMNDYSLRVSSAIRGPKADLVFAVAVLQHYADIIKKGMEPEELEMVDELIKEAAESSAIIEANIPRGMLNDA